MQALAFVLVPKERLELSRGHPRWILNPLRLPFRHFGLTKWGNYRFETLLSQQSDFNLRKIMFLNFIKTHSWGNMR